MSDATTSEADGTPANAPAERPGNERFMGLAAGAVTLAMACLLVGALIGALAVDFGSSPDVWKARVRLMSVSRQGLYGGVLISLGLLIALGFVQRATTKVTAVVTGVVGTSVWLGVLMALNIYVDITNIEPADVAIATVLGDLAALVMLVVACWWGVAMTGAAKR